MFLPLNFNFYNQKLVLEVSVNDFTAFCFLVLSKLMTLALTLKVKGAGIVIPLNN
jgi:hypothetical protein